MPCLAELQRRDWLVIKFDGMLEKAGSNYQSLTKQVFHPSHGIYALMCLLRLLLHHAFMLLLARIYSVALLSLLRAVFFSA
jgi:hypothetical protein